MIYLPRARAVFIHNPKAAGTAVTAALEAAFPDARKWWGRAYLPHLDMVRDMAHIPAAEMRAFLPRRARPRFTFGLVRDPYARFVSALKHFHAHSGYAMRLSPDTFIDRYLNHTTLRSDWRFVHFCPQYRFFYRGDKPAVDLIGRFESAPAFFAEVSERLGTPIDVASENVAAEGEVVLSDAAVAAINHFYARDFVLLGYPQRPARGAPMLGKRMIYAGFEALWPEERSLDTTSLCME